MSLLGDTTVGSREVPHELCCLDTFNLFIVFALEFNLSWSTELSLLVAARLDISVDYGFLEVTLLILEEETLAIGLNKFYFWWTFWLDLKSLRSGERASFFYVLFKAWLGKWLPRFEVVAPSMLELKLFWVIPIAEPLLELALLRRRRIDLLFD